MKGNGVFGTERHKGSRILLVCGTESWLLRTANRRYIIDQVVLYYSIIIYILGRLSRNSASVLMNDGLRIF